MLITEQRELFITDYPRFQSFGLNIFYFFPEKGLDIARCYMKSSSNPLLFVKLLWVGVNINSCNMLLSFQAPYSILSSKMSSIFFFNR